MWLPGVNEGSVTESLVCCEAVGKPEKEWSSEIKAPGSISKCREASVDMFAEESARFMVPDCWGEECR